MLTRHYARQTVARRGAIQLLMYVVAFALLLTLSFRVADMVTYLLIAGLWITAMCYGSLRTTSDWLYAESHLATRYRLAWLSARRRAMRRSTYRSPN